MPLTAFVVLVGVADASGVLVAIAIAPLVGVAVAVALGVLDPPLDLVGVGVGWFPPV